MISSELQTKIKKIKIHTKRIMQSALAGDYISAFKGSGLEFDQIREYQMGDDIRAIDWNSSAKMNKLMVKQFIEERERTIILAIDVSASTAYSSQHELRKETVAQLAGTLAFVAAHNKDNVGALFFSDIIEQWIPPSKGNVHLGKIIETIFTLKPAHKGTNLTEALRFLVKLKSRNAVVFMISDWITEDTDYYKFLSVARCKYDFVGIRLLDGAESKLPDLGLVEICDSESAASYTIDTRGARSAHHPINKFLTLRALEQKKTFEKYHLDLLDLAVGKPFVNPLVTFFHQRIRRQI